MFHFAPFVCAFPLTQGAGVKQFQSRSLRSKFWVAVKCRGGEVGRTTFPSTTPPPRLLVRQPTHSETLTEVSLFLQMVIAGAVVWGGVRLVHRFHQLFVVQRCRLVHRFENFRRAIVQRFIVVVEFTFLAATACTVTSMTLGILQRLDVTLFWGRK